MAFPCDDCQCNLGQRYAECSKGYDPQYGDCPPEERVPYESYHGFSEQALEAGDYRGHLERDDGGYRE